VEHRRAASLDERCDQIGAMSSVELKAEAARLHAEGQPDFLSGWVPMEQIKRGPATKGKVPAVKILKVPEMKKRLKAHARSVEFPPDSSPCS